MWSHTAVMRILIDAGVDVNIEDDDGHRPLHLVAKWDHFEAAEILLAAKAEVNITNHTKVLLFLIKLHLKLHFGTSGQRSLACSERREVTSLPSQRKD